MSGTERYSILIVDPDEATRLTLADLLRDRDEYRVLVPGDGHEAVKMFVEESRIDIVLTDIHMPGFNCLELMSDMQRLKHRPEILIMTSDGSAEVVEQARRIGARSIILKPFEHLDLIETEVEKAVQALFEARAAGPSGTTSPPAARRDAAGAPNPPAAPPSTPKPVAASPALRPQAPPASAPPPSPPAIDAAPEDEEEIFIGNETPDPVHTPPAAMPATVNAPPAVVNAPPAIDAATRTPPAPPSSPGPVPNVRIEPPAAIPAGGRTDGSPARAKVPPRPQTTPPVENAVPHLEQAVRAVGGRPAASPSPLRELGSGGGAPKQPPEPPGGDKARGRVGLPDLGALKSKLSDKRSDLSGGHLARSFPDLAPAGGSPQGAAAGMEGAAPPRTAAAEGPNAPRAASLPASDAAEKGSMVVDIDTNEAASAAAAPARQELKSQHVPPELETILAAGAAVDLDRMTLQIPIICLQTWEEQAALEALRPLAGDMKRAFFTWSATRGIVKEDGTVMGEMYCDPIQALEFVRRQKANGLFVLIDFHNCLGDRKVLRLLREMFDAGETGRGILVLTGPVIAIPPELQPACQRFDWPRGGGVDFEQILNEVRDELSTAGGAPIDLDPETRRLLSERVKEMPAGRVRFEVLCALRGRERGGGEA